MITSAKVPDIAEIFSEHIKEYSSHFGDLTEKQKKVVKHITECRTAAMGGHEFICDNCADYLLLFNSCRDRHCPVCQGAARAAWIHKRTEELLPIGHFHVVFTVPYELNSIALRNKSVFYDILFKASSETLTQLGKDPRWLGAEIGIIAILHTWGQNLMDHPHIHCIVPGGGIRLDGKKWVSFRNNYLIPITVLSEVFRGKFIYYFKEAVAQKKITFTGECQRYENEIVFKSLVRKLWKKNWVVFSKEPFGESVHLVKYLGRYTHRIAISNDRIIKHDDDKVQFKWKDYADENKMKVMEVRAVEFIRRFFLHILPDHFTRIRYFGFMSNSNKNKKLPECFRLLEKRFEKKKLQLKRVADILREVAGIDITKCIRCAEGHYMNVGTYQAYHQLYFE